MLSTLEADRTRVADIEAQILELERSLSALQNPDREGILSPTLLTQICRKWREIALGTPALWRAIALLLPSIPLERQARIAEIWLGRSCPLSIQIIDDRYENDSQAVLAAPTHCARWEHLKLDLLSPSSQLLTIQGPMPLLRHLDYALEEELASPVVFVLHEVPLLRIATLNDLAAANVVLPWAQLTSLVLHKVYPHECVPVLQRTPNLVHCELELYHEFPHHQLADITFPCLEYLTLKDPGGEPVRGYLETLIVPTLRSLAVAESFLQPSPIESLTSFISKSGCKLQQVRITDDRTVAKNSYRRAFPLIPEFAFDGPYYNIETLNEEEESDSSNGETQ
ncbi:hypothetical protein B0H13DRAFT_2534242 [Mycena leptocephala]|nr:hypothetical protein B0H13DRAFT_2534242 [Mycena leptocephala]